MRHFLTLKDYTKEEILEIVDLGLKIKKEFKAKAQPPYLNGQTLSMIFEKSSTRTRVSFESGIFQLGGHGLFLSNKDIQLGRGEQVKDTARVISSMTDMIMIRTFEHSRLEEFASFSSVPVINGLTDLYHPVQLLADYMTMIEHSMHIDPVVAYVGDGNNMTHSWMMLASKLGFELRIATPNGYEVDEGVMKDAQAFCKQSGGKIVVTNDPNEAAKGATVVTTDTWASMGQEDEKEVRAKAFKGYMVDETMMGLCKEGAVFLHCLPAYRGQEVSEEVLEGPRSLIFQEAENRLHAQKGLMVWLDLHR